MKYIDAEKLIAEIKRLQCEQGFEDGIEERGYQFAIKDILDIINSLQHESTPSKEEIVDRIADWISGNTDFFFNGDTKEVMNEIKKLV